MRVQHLPDGAERFAAELRSHSIGPVNVRVHHSQQTNWLSLLLEFLVNSGMIAPEDTHAHHRDGDRSLRGQEKNSMAGCRKGIVNGIAGKSTRIATVHTTWTLKLNADTQS